MHDIAVQLPDQEATRRLGFNLAQAAGGGALIRLSGPLGAGKTTLVQGAAQALGVAEVVNSPTFTMINEYTSGRLPLYHLDLYRLSESADNAKADNRATEEMLALELDELLSAPALVCVEWAEHLDRYFEGQDLITVELNYVHQAGQAAGAGEVLPESGRQAVIRATGQHSSQIVASVRNVYFS